jgi:hypothetical protein
MSPTQPQSTARRWDFLTNHAHVLVCVARDPAARLRDIAEAVGITERAAHRIVSELVEGGYLKRERQGRRNQYTVEAKSPLRHPLTAEHEVGELLGLLLKGQPDAPGATNGARSRTRKAKDGS